MPATDLSNREVRLLRLRAQGLLPGSGFSTIEETARGCLCLQAQDVPTARLALRARTGGLTVTSASREAERTAVCRSWLMRNTVHLFADEDLAWMRPLLASTPMRQAYRRLEQLGVAANVPGALQALGRKLKAGPLSRAEARELLAAQGIAAGEANQAFYWTLHAAALEGVLVMRPALDTRSPLAAAPEYRPKAGDWGELARRYLAAYGPATVRDFAYWAKIRLADARSGWEQATGTVEVRTEAGTMTALAGGIDPPASDEPVIRLLGTWDNYMLGHKGRELAVEKDAHAQLLPLLSGFRCAIADGVVFASWRLERKGGAVTVALRPFGRLPRAFRQGLERETADLGRFLETDATLRVGRVAT